MALEQRHEHALDEHGLAVEDVDRRIGDLAMDEQRHADLRHAGEHRVEPATSVTPAAEFVVACAG